MSNLIPIPTLHLFPVLDRMLIQLLRSLSPEDWQKPTVAKLWKVKDVAAHLLDTNMRAISSLHQYNGKPPQNINSYQDLIDYLNHLNAVWVEAMDRVSPQQITDLLEITGVQYHQYLQSLNPFEPAMYSVSWAGEDVSANWFHIAREYTEKWHHQQQIRHAVGIHGIVTPELFYPCIDTFMRGLPYNYRNVEAATGTVIEIIISGEAGGNWYLKKTDTIWLLNKDNDSKPSVSVSIDPEIAWQFFTKAITPAYARERSTVTGQQFLAYGIFSTISVMA